MNFALKKCSLVCLGQLANFDEMLNKERHRNDALSNSLRAHWAKIIKVRIVSEGPKILQNLHCRFDRYYIGQIYGGDFA